MELCAFPSLGQPCLQQGRLNTLFLSLSLCLFLTLWPSLHSLSLIDISPLFLFPLSNFHCLFFPNSVVTLLFLRQKAVAGAAGVRSLSWNAAVEEETKISVRFRFRQKATTASTPMRARPSVKCNPCQFFCYYWVVVVLFFVFFRSLPPKSFGSLDRIFLNRSFAWPTQAKLLSGRFSGQSVKVPSSPTQSDHHRFNLF